MPIAWPNVEISLYNILVYIHNMVLLLADILMAKLVANHIIFKYN